MPSVQIAVYVRDEDFVTYLRHKSDLHSAVQCGFKRVFAQCLVGVKFVDNGSSDHKRKSEVLEDERRKGIGREEVRKVFKG